MWQEEEEEVGAWEEVGGKGVGEKKKMNGKRERQKVASRKRKCNRYGEENSRDGGRRDEEEEEGEGVRKRKG